MDERSTIDKRARIRELNDRFRRDLMAGDILGKVVMTSGINALSVDDQANIFARVRSFDDFTEDDDPYGEHDFGALDGHGQKIFWKIDYYDPLLEQGSEDPSDLEKTVRVLTIMLADEY